MRVGIITFHSSHNYGSMLQAYAMQQVVEDAGMDAAIIDYRDPKNERHYRLVRTFSKKCLLLDTLFLHWRKRRSDGFKKFASRYYNLEPTRLTTNEALRVWLDNRFDALICGSDQIWNPVCTGGPAPAYFLEFAKEKPMRKVAYAPSLGHSEIDSKHVDAFKALLGHLDAISMREESGIAAVSTLTDKPIVRVLDPTLLLSAERWSRIAVKPPERVRRKPYLLLYALEDNDEMLATAKAVAKSHDLHIITLSPGHLRKGIRDFRLPDPSEFLGLIKNAACVVTNSFHATVFSVLFEKNFIVYPTSLSGSRMTDLLNRLGLAHRIAIGDNAEDRIMSKVSYDEAKQKLAEEVAVSMNFLVDALGDDARPRPPRPPRREE